MKFLAKSTRLAENLIIHFFLSVGRTKQRRQSTPSVFSCFVIRPQGGTCILSSSILRSLVLFVAPSVVQHWNCLTNLFFEVMFSHLLYRPIKNRPVPGTADSENNNGAGIYRPHIQILVVGNAKKALYLPM